MTLLAKLLRWTAAAAILAPGLSSQVIGGGWTTAREFSGVRAGDSLGNSVAIVPDLDGDGCDDFLVGSYAADPGGSTDAGVALVFSGLTGALIRRHSGAAAGDSLGEKVASAGDVDGDGYGDYLVGAPNTLVGGFSNAGAAFVYSGFTGALLYRFDGTASGQQLGKALDGAGDVDGDGRDDLVVGVANATVGGFSRGGEVSLYSGATGSLIRSFYGGQIDAFLGSAVAGAGDVDNDGLDDVILGAEGMDLGGLVDCGAAYVVTGGGSFLHVFAGVADGEYAGSAVCGAGDADGDGVPDLAVGAWNSGAAGSRAGEARLYSGDTGALLHAFRGDAGDCLGWSLSGAGDLDGDGYDDLLVGAPFSDPFVDSTGECYAYSGRDGEMLIRCRGKAIGDWFGEEVAGGGDLDGDGVPDLVVGAWLAAPGGLSEAGSAYVLYGYRPFLSADLREVSSAAGAVVNFQLDFPVLDAGRGFQLLGSATGIGPSTFGSVELPLAKGDSLWKAMLSASPPSTFSAVRGTLDALGDAALTLTLSAGSSASLIGRTLHFAAVSYAPPAVVVRASAAMPLTFVP